MKSILLLAVLLLSLGAQAQSPYWRPVASGAQKNLLSISFGSPQVGYIVGADSLLLRTVDGGVTWSPVTFSGLQFPLGSPDIIHVNFVSAGTGFAIVGSIVNPVYKGALYKTTDSGRTWTSLVTGNIAAARTYFFDANNGYEIGAAFFGGRTIIRQSAGTWGAEQYLSLNPAEFLHGIDFRNRQTGIVGGAGGYVHRTFDGGATWDTVKTVVDTMINDLKFLSSRSIMAGTDDAGGGILISHDTGRTWNTDARTLTFAYPAIKGVAKSALDSFIAVGHASFGHSGIILWNDSLFANNQMTDQRLNAVVMRDNSVAYIVGDSGTILTNRMALLGVARAPGAMPPMLYPNPAAGVCYSEAPYRHTLRMYDAAGRIVWMEPQPALRHTIRLEGLSAGLYLVQTLSEAGAVVSQKLVVE